MKNEKNFYDILNSKFTHREIPYDEENWNAMRTMIDSSRAAKKRVMWLVASLSLLLCAGGAFALYQWSNKGIKQNTNVVTVSAVNNTNQNTNSITAATTNAGQPVNSITAAVKASAEPRETSPGKAAGSNTGISVENNVNAAHSNQTNSQPIANNIVSPAIAASNNATSNRRRNHGKFYANQDNNPTTTSGNITASGSDIKNTGSPNNTTNAETNNSSANSVSVTGSTVPAPALNSIAKTATVSTSKTTGNKADTASALANTAPQRFSDEPRVFMGKTNIFSIEAGIEYSGGWQIGTINQGQGFNPLVGVGYSHYMGSKIFLKTGIQFSSFGNMNTITYNYQHTVGNEIYDSVITTKRLYFIKIPVQLEYFVGRKQKSSIGLGGSVWYLLGNSGYATTYQQLDNNPPMNIVQYSQNASLNGYSKVNASAYALYRYTFSRKFSMYGIYYFEITNMKNNAFFGDAIVQRTRGFQIVASYSL